MAAGLYEYESMRMAAEGGRSVAPAPSPDRYGSPATSPRQTQVAVPSETVDENTRLYEENMAMARSGNEEAAFVMQGLAPLEARMKRAAQSGDVEAVTAIADETDRFLESHPTLPRWMGIAETGAQGKAAAARLAKVLDGSYKVEWGQGLADDMSEEAKAKKAAMVSKRLMVGTDVARAMFDRDSDMYPVFGRFSGLTMAQKDLTPQGAILQDMQADTLRGVAGLVKSVGVGDGGFSGWDDAGKFVSAFMGLAGKNGVYPGDAVLERVARGYVSSGGMSARDYVAQYSDLVGRLQSVQSGGKDQKGQAASVSARMSAHEAHGLASAFIQLRSEKPELADVAPGPEWSDALVSAAASVRAASDLFGVGARAGAGWSRKVAAVALTSMGYQADDGGLGRMVTDAASDLSGLVSEPTRRLMTTLAEGQGRAQVGTMQSANPYSNLEMMSVKSLGREMVKLAGGVDGAMPSGRSWGALKKFASGNGAARQRLVDVVAKSYDLRFGDEGLSHALAEGTVARFLGESDDGRTLEERLKGMTKLFEPDGGPAVPAVARISPGMGDDAYYMALASAARNPDFVVPSMKGDGRLRTAVRDFASLTLDRKNVGKTPQASMRWHRAFGDLAVAAGVEDVGGLVSSGYLTRAFTGLDKLESVKDARKIVSMVDDVVSRPLSIDGVVALALMFRDPKRKSALQKALTPSGASAGGGMVPFGPGESAADLVKVDRVVRAVDQALAGFGVSRNMTVQQALAALAASGDLEKSTFVSSGFLDPKNPNNLSAKGVLSRLQQEAYADPHTEKGPAPDPLSAAARRAYRTFETRDGFLRRAISEALEHARAQGFRDEALVAAESMFSRRFAEAYRNGGPAAVDALKDKYLALRQRFFPTVNFQDGSVNTATVRPSARVLTDEEYEAAVTEMTAGLAAAGKPVDREVFYATDATGFASWKDQQNLAKTAALANARRSSEE